MAMTSDAVTAHYYDGGDLTEVIRESLRRAGKDVETVTAVDLAAVDEFHIRGRQATLQLADRMKLTEASRVLDIGSGLGGPARTVAETYGSHVTGIDLTEAYCDAATAMSDWVGLGHRVAFRRGDATDLPFADGDFDAVMTIHVAMNIPAKGTMYAEARRVLKTGGVFAGYDVMQGEGGEVLFPVPWARAPSMSHLATPDETKSLLAEAGFRVLEVLDSTRESQVWFEDLAARMKRSGSPPLTFQVVLGNDFPEMARNQVRNLTERRIRTVTYVCEA